MKTYYVYMLTNSGNRVLYIGVTNNLQRRFLEHHEKQNDGFTAKYNCNKLVFYEVAAQISTMQLYGRSS